MGKIAGSRRSIANLAPYLSALVNKRRVKRRTVHEALDQNLWIQDIQGALTVLCLLNIWNYGTEVELQPDVSDIRRWRFTESGQYSSKSAYRSLFIGSVTFEPWELLHKLEDLGTKEMLFFL